MEILLLGSVAFDYTYCDFIKTNAFVNMMTNCLYWYSWCCTIVVKRALGCCHLWCCYICSYVRLLLMDVNNACLLVCLLLFCIVGVYLAVDYCNGWPLAGRIGGWVMIKYMNRYYCCQYTICLYVYIIYLCFVMVYRQDWLFHLFIRQVQLCFLCWHRVCFMNSCWWSQCTPGGQLT